MQLYEQAVQYTDAHIGRLLNELDRLGHLLNTVVVLVADHGEEFLEHGRWGHFENNLYDEILHVPLIIHVPNSITGQVVKCQVRTLDIMPTILDLCGCSWPNGLEGTSLAPCWTQAAAEYEATLSISEMWRERWHIIAVRTEAFKYIWDSRQPDQPQLFDLQADPGERQNVCQQYPEQARQFQSHVDAHLQRGGQTAPATAGAEPELDEEIVRRLRDLGYVE
jgi:arylsulfatase A-like enzyme